MVQILNEQSFAVDITRLKRNARIIMETLDYQDFDLGILLTTPDKIHEYNKQYRQQNKPTDILSFPYHHIKAGQRIEATSDDDMNLGDIIMCPEYIHADLERWNRTYQERIDILLVHGICHLLGYDHIEDDDYEVMKLQEDALLEKILQQEQ